MVEEKIGKVTLRVSQSYPGSWKYETEGNKGEVGESNGGYASKEEALVAGRQCIRTNIKNRILSALIVDH